MGTHSGSRSGIIALLTLVHFVKRDLEALRPPVFWPNAFVDRHQWLRYVSRGCYDSMPLLSYGADWNVCGLDVVRWNVVILGRTDGSYIPPLVTGNIAKTWGQRLQSPTRRFL